MLIFTEGFLLRLLQTLPRGVRDDRDVGDGRAATGVSRGLATLPRPSAPSSAGLSLRRERLV